jgi:predicted DNA-binding transcriptional regulator YafY
MNKLERLYKLRQLLSTRRALPTTELRARLGISRATLGRHLNELGDILHTPVFFDREQGGYRLQAFHDGDQHELPGLWFSANEIHALLTMQHLLSKLDTGGLLGPHIEPLQKRLTQLLGAAHDPAGEVTRRIRIETLGARAFQLDHFQAIGSALLRRLRLSLEYHSRGKNQTRIRQVSPQRLMHYRDNWYLDAWCHEEDALRRFSVDAIRRAEILDTTANDIPEATLDQALGNGYGVFAGAEVQWAVLRFSPERSRWVAQEKWHPAQEGRPLPDGGYELRIPYSHDPELLMDILRHGRHVTVLSPESLREAVRTEHLLAARNFDPVSGIEHGGGENGPNLKGARK